MAPPILNKDYYYVLKNRILKFNNRYQEKLMAKGDHRITEDMFDIFYESWKTIAQEHAKSLDVKDIPVDEVISEDLFDQFLQGAKALSDSLSNLAYNLDLGEVYIEQEREERDYTHLSREIFEICMLATYTYTNFFQQCKYIRDYGIEPGTGPRRAKDMAKVLFPDSWHIFDTPHSSQLLLENPLMPFQFEIDKNVYRDEKTYQLHTEPKKRKSYEKIHEENLKAQAERIDRLDQERKQKKIDQENAIKQGFIDDENRRIIEEKRRNPQMGDYSVYGTFRNVLRTVSNFDPPGDQYEHFYAIYKQKLDIDENVLNAQTLIYAMQEIPSDTLSDATYFCESVLPIYRQLQSAAFESAARKCIENNTPIDLNDVSRKVDEVMAALCCTVNALEFQRDDEGARNVAAEMLNGTFGGHSNPRFNQWMRAAAIEHVRAECHLKGIEAFNESAEAIFNFYSEGDMSSKQIAMNARRDAAGYTQYKESGSKQDGAFAQAIMRGSFMDRAYALEKRIETRYASGWSKFFRMVSYFRQKNALAEMKTALGIAQGTRVSDVYLEDRLSNVVKDFSNPGEVHLGMKIFTKSKKDSAAEHARLMLKNALDGKELPHLDDFSDEIKKFEESGQDLRGLDNEIVQQRKKEFEEQERKQREEEERKRREEEERQRKIEEDRLKRIEEEKEREKQRLFDEAVREEKETIYFEQLDSKQIKVQNLQEDLAKITKEEEEKWNDYKLKVAEYDLKIQNMITLEDQHNFNIAELKRYEKEAEVLTNKLNEEIQRIMNQEVSEKKMDAVKKQAEKNAEKHIAGGKALKDGEKLSAKIENATRNITQDLNTINLKINNQRDIIKQYNDKRLEFERIRREYIQKVGVYSENWKSVHMALKKAEEDYNNFKDNKEKILETGEGLSFSMKEFMNKDNPNARNSVFVSVSPADGNDIRYTVVRDSDVYDSNIEVEPPVAENDGRNAVNGKSKNI